MEMYLKEKGGEELEHEYHREEGNIHQEMSQGEITTV